MTAESKHLQNLQQVQSNYSIKTNIVVHCWSSVFDTVAGTMEEEHKKYFLKEWLIPVMKEKVARSDNKKFRTSEWQKRDKVKSQITKTIAYKTNGYHS